MYHSVTDRPPAATRDLAVQPGALVEQFGHLKDAGFTPLTFADLVARHGDGGPELPARPVVITFDDGYADFHTEALPILEQFGFAATVFVTTGWLADAGPHAAGRPLDRTLTWSQVKEAAAHGVELAGHSHSHPQLDQIDGAALREELGRNKALLEDELGRPVATMAADGGPRHHDDQVPSRCRRARSACVVPEGADADQRVRRGAPNEVGRSPFPVGSPPGQVRVTGGHSGCLTPRRT
jgi:peptidoglycan/xylan/chitin deacetylase (PgdA/CDA1 family)